jgi:peptidase S41-like protein
MSRSASLFGFLLLAAACSSSDPASQGAAPDGGVPVDPVLECPDVGATRCAGSKVQTCEKRGENTAWNDAAECPGDQTCRESTCQDPTARQVAQAASIAALVDALAPSTGWHEAVDAEAVKARERKAVLKGDGTDAPFFGAAWHTMNAFPQGHQSLFSLDASVCGKAIANQQTSRFGVCGRPSSAGLAVTFARSGNKLGLAVGDVITQAGADTGDALYEASYQRPVCGGVFPAASGRRYAGAATFFGSVPSGTKLTVRALNGTTREVTVPAEKDTTATDCTDPFSRSRAIYAEAKVRPDGVAVIRLPSFFPYDKALPVNPTQAELDAFVAAYQAEIQKVFDSVKTAPGIVWDTRGNTGGITTVGLAIVSGFATAKKTAVSYCRTRTTGSSPPAYDAERYAVYGVDPGGPFAYAGKVAVVTDGLAYSAGDYFPLAVAKASSTPVVGSASAGAYGGGRSPIELDGPPKLSANFDPTGCFDGVTDKPLEGAPLPPKAAVELDAKDLAAGKDTIVERAVIELGL